MQPSGGSLPVTATFSVAVRGGDARLQDALGRLLRLWEERTGLTFARTPQGRFASSAPAVLEIECESPGMAVPALGEDESYAIDVEPAHAVLRARTTTGALRGLATLQQLLQGGADGWCLPAVRIQDGPRFPWRGLLIDVCRHWQPMEVIKRNLDGMALVKLNVLHFHLTEDQGFRIESRRFPKLHELGSDGLYFTQEQIREIVAYAAARGIRVVPEFDVPGHATSWLVAYPELAAGPGPYEIERRWGVFDPVFDPTNEAVYAMLDGFLGEMAALFPDPYVHIGGDENNGKQWSANARIQAFIRERGLKDNAGLHAYFNRRVHEILARHGKKLMGWEEIMQPDLPADSIVHAWSGKDSLTAAVRRGYAVVLSKGYYIDLMQNAAEHYAIDPAAAQAGMTEAEQRRILGGEATMWAEWVSPENIDSRIWPRTAAIAERLWSPGTVTDVADMYRRLAIAGSRLEEAGLLHEKNRDAMIRRFAGQQIVPATLGELCTLIDAIEPLFVYQRRRLQPDVTQFMPLTGLVDCARPDSAAARSFVGAVEQGLFGAPSFPAGAAGCARSLGAWKSAADAVLACRHELPRWNEIEPVAQALQRVAQAGEEALAALAEGRRMSPEWRAERLAALNQSAKLPVAVRLPMLPAVRLLVAAASEQEHRAAMTPEAWRRHVQNLANAPAANQPAP